MLRPAKALGCFVIRQDHLTNENADMSSPAKKGALDTEETSKFKTSFHAYGSMLVKAIGSATRTNAGRSVSPWDRREMTYVFHTEQEKLSRRKGIVVCGSSAGSSFGEKRHPST
jgi:hypothetical protein